MVIISWDLTPLLLMSGILWIDLGLTQVSNLSNHPPYLLVKQYVVGSEVSVDYGAQWRGKTVQVLQTTGHIAENAVLGRERDRGLGAGFKVLAEGGVHELHDQCGESCGLVKMDTNHLDDVGVTQIEHSMTFLLKSLNHR